MLQLQGWSLNCMKQTVNTARSNTGLVPTNKLLASCFVAVLHVKRRPLINAGYVHERGREHYSKLAEVSIHLNNRPFITYRVFSIT